MRDLHCEPDIDEGQYEKVERFTIFNYSSVLPEAISDSEQKIKRANITMRNPTEF